MVIKKMADKDSLRPIPVRNMGPPRDAMTIIKCITNKAILKQAISFFGCFRFSKLMEPCRSCQWHQLNVLHCLDSWEDVCFCVSCNGMQEENHICDEYPSDYDEDESENLLDE